MAALTPLNPTHPWRQGDADRAVPACAPDRAVPYLEGSDDGVPERDADWRIAAA